MEDLYERSRVARTPRDSGEISRRTEMSPQSTVAKSFGTLTDSEFAVFMRSRVVQSSPEVGRIISASRSDPSGRQLRAVLKSLPIVKSRELARVPDGLQEVTTYRYKGRDLVRLHGRRVANAASVLPQEVPGSELHSYFQPASLTRVTAVSQEEDPYLTVDELGDGVAELEAMEYEFDGVDIAEEYAFVDWEDWYDLQLVSAESAESPLLRRVSNFNCDASVLAVARPASVTRAKSCFDAHFEKVAAAYGSGQMIRSAISGARAAYSVAIAATGSNAVVVSTVRTSLMFGWIGVGALGVATISYGAYLAYQCYNESSTVNWAPPAAKGSRPLQSAMRRDPSLAFEFFSSRHLEHRAQTIDT